MLVASLSHFDKMAGGRCAGATVVAPRFVEAVAHCLAYGAKMECVRFL